MCSPDYDHLSMEALKIQTQLNNFVFRDNITTTYIPAVLVEANRNIASISFTFSQCSVKSLDMEELRVALQSFCARHGINFTKVYRIVICLDPLVFKAQAEFLIN